MILNLELQWIEVMSKRQGRNIKEYNSVCRDSLKKKIVACYGNWKGISMIAVRGMEKEEGRKKEVREESKPSWKPSKNLGRPVK